MTSVILPAEFLSEAWPLRAALLRGKPSRLPELFDAPELTSVEALVATGAPTDLWWQEDVLRSVAVESAGAAWLFSRGGVTLRLAAIDQHVPSLRVVLDEITTSLATPIGRSYINIYVSPSGMRTPMHFDGSEVFIAQIHGRKRWRYAPNFAVTNPDWAWSGGEPSESERDQIEIEFPVAMPAGATETLLNPGDILFLPRGWWHEAEADGEDNSISASLTFECLTLLDIAVGVLRRALIRDPTWRRPAGGLLADPAGIAHNLLDEKLRNLGRMLAEQGLEF